MLKIDQSFVQDIGCDRSSEAIVTSMISLAHNLGMQAIAEGVEELHQLAFLRARHCNQVQGYLISRPVGAEAISAMLGNAAAGTSLQAAVAGEPLAEPVYGAP